MYLDKLKVFSSIVEAGSYAKAAKQTGQYSTSLIRSIQQLEAELSTKLFDRHYRGVTLTKDGQEVYALAKRIINDAEKTKKLILARNNKMDSDLKDQAIKITSSIGIAENWLPFLMADLKEKFPMLKIYILGHDSNLENYIDETDILISPFIPNRDDIIQKEYYTFSFKYYASREYIKKHGRPKTIKDISKHKIVKFTSNSNAPFHKTSIETHEFDYEVNLSTVEYNLVKLGQGIGMLPADLKSIRSADIIDLFPETIISKVPTYFSYSKSFEKHKYVQQLYAFLKEYDHTKLA